MYILIYEEAQNHVVGPSGSSIGKEFGLCSDEKQTWELELGLKVILYPILREAYRNNE